MKNKTKALVTLALLSALAAVTSIWNIYWSPTSRTSLNFLPYALTGMQFSPIQSSIVGIVGDLVGYVVRPVGPYFPGYTLSAAGTAVLYALFLYRRPVRLWRVALAQLTIMLTISLGLNALWSYINTGIGGAAFYSTTRIIKCLLEYPFQVALITYSARYIRKVIKSDEK